jgi:hypothetical protein
MKSSDGGFVHIKHEWDVYTERVYLAARPVLGAVNKVLQSVFGTAKRSSQQHILDGDTVKNTPAGVARDIADVQLIRDYFADKDVWDASDTALRNVDTGDLASAGVNVHEAANIGNDILATMVGTAVANYKHCKNQQCVTMADQAKARVYDGGNVIGKCEPAFAFQRYFLYSEAHDTLTAAALAAYELAAYPLSLGATTDSLLSPNKPQLSKAMRSRCTDPDAGELHQVAGLRSNYLNVWDMGSLLHRKTDWNDAKTYGDVVRLYTDHVVRLGGKHLVVFDRYDLGAQTKDNTHLKRSQNGLANDLSFDHNKPTDVAAFVGTRCKFDKTKRSRFLSNPRTKQLLLTAVQAEMDRANNVQTHRGEAADADADIAKVAVARCKDGADVVVIGEDTDVLVLLLHHYWSTCRDTDAGDLYYMSEIRSKKTGEHTSWNVPYLCAVLGDRVLEVVLACHAVGGCDTCSGFFGHGKGAVLELLETDDTFFECLKLFNEKKGVVDPQALAMAGRYVIASMYQKPSGKDTIQSVMAGQCTHTELDRVRLEVLKKKDVHKGEVVDYRTIPCTTDAADHHTLRVYLQVSDWAGNQKLDPTEYGWTLKDHPLHAPGATNPKAYFPKWTEKGALPPGLVEIIKCGCAADRCINKQCRCMRANQPCSDLCTNCKGVSCHNPAAQGTPDPETDQGPGQPDPTLAVAAATA